MGRRRLALVVALAWIAGCDRNIEPFDPNEAVAKPDLSKIFPEGAERSGDGEALRGVMPGLDAPAATPPGGEGAPLAGTIRVADELAQRVPPGAVLFLIARRGESGPPLAVKRISGPSFPLEFEIGPGDRMIKSMPFEGTLQLSARLDGDGNATSRTPGDLLSSTAAQAQPGDSGVQLVIDSVL